MKLSTFSIVARDTESGLIAVAGGTNWFCYGRWVPHIEAGYGAVATQAETNMAYAINAISDLKKGEPSQIALDKALSKEVDVDGVYQLLIIDKEGNTACHTGNNCHDYAGSITEQNLGVAGNTLVSEETIKAVADYFHDSTEPFELKVIRSLRAGQAAGGDIRGMKSAAIKVAKMENTGEYWNDITMDLRVDENIDPLKELERLYFVAKAYEYIGLAESTEDAKERLELYKKGLELDPTNNEIMFWMARTYFELGNADESDHYRKIIRATNDNWDEYWKRVNKD